MDETHTQASAILQEPMKKTCITVFEMLFNEYSTKFTT